MIVGIQPPQGSGPALQDGQWLNGLANGYNRSYINGLTAHAGGTKAAALQIPAAVALVQFDTVTTNGDSALLPQALAGSEVTVISSGAATMSVYGKGADTINNAATATAFSMATNTTARFVCAKDGQWKAILSA
jgi:hypothetical protein